MRKNSLAPSSAETGNDLQETRELIKLGVEMVEAGTPTISPEAIHAWMLGPEDAAFPKPDIFRS